MKHIKGNTPKCFECYYYTECGQNEPGASDGWCSHPRQCFYGINGRKRPEPLPRIAVRAGGECTWWEDAEDRTTHYEIMTGIKPD